VSITTASVIVVSRHRTAALLRCLASLCQQDHPAMEVIVVADPEALAAVQAAALPGRLVAFDEANISAARNAGIAAAGGEVLAFLDDDAVAEPTWLSRLTAPFAAAEVVAATGFVRGRNGISWQWRAGEVDCFAQDHPLPDQAAVYRGSEARAVKTQGTNCAFRAKVLRRVGGFDPAYRFFLDEADLNLRLASEGATAVVPEAEVLHGFAASARRRADRVPLSLHEIAASTAVFLRRHAGPAHLERGWLRLHAEQAARVAALGRAGRITAAEQVALMDSLAAGWAAGLARPLPNLLPLAETADFTPLPHGGPRPGKVFAGRIWQKTRLIAEARAHAEAGGIATVICLSPTARPHRVAFLESGIWLQTGGIFGQSLREGPRLRLVRFSTRIREEVARIAACRPVSG